MRRWAVIGGLALALVATAGGAQQAVQTHAAPRPVAVRSTELPAMQALFDGYVADNKMPGIVGAFGVGDRPTMFVSAGRIADGAQAAAATPDSLWRIYSMTKPITGMAAMMLVEDGKLSLDDPLSKYFPAFAKMRVLTSPDTSLDARPATKPILIRNLLTHTAGLGYSINAKGPLLHEYERLGLVPAQLNASTEAKAREVRPNSLIAFAERAAQAPLVYEPGTRWHYSIALDVMAAVIERVSGMPFERFVQTRLFAPLKMRDTFWTVPPADVGRFATNYVFMGDQRVPLDPAATSPYLARPSFPYGGAGLVSSARDYDRFLHMLQDEGTLDGVRVMKPETVRLALSNLLPAGVVFEDKGQAMGFGAGGSVWLADGPGGYPGKGTYGWGGAAGTIAWVDPNRDVRGTVMVQYFPDDRWPVRRDVATALAHDALRLRTSGGMK